MRIWTTLVRNVYVRNDVTCIKINGKLRHAFQFFIWVFSNSSCSHTFSAAFCSFNTVSIAYIAITQMTMTHWRHIKKLLKLWWQFFLNMRTDNCNDFVYVHLISVAMSHCGNTHKVYCILQFKLQITFKMVMKRCKILFLFSKHRAYLNVMATHALQWQFISKSRNIQLGSYPLLCH